jgi:hypothetical protein
VSTKSDGPDANQGAFGDADPADVAEQRLSVDPDAGEGSVDDDAVEILDLTIEAEPADVLEQRRSVGGEEDYPRG